MQRKPLVVDATLLSIAGSDSSGGAGIQADLKTMTSIGVYGAAAITCLTVQNALGVQSIQALDSDLVHAQIQAVLEVHHVTHIKIGMTGNRDILQTLGGCLGGFDGEVIYDPVLAASTGESLLSSDGLEALHENLLNRVSYLTPNIPELEVLAGKGIKTGKEGLSSAVALLQGFPSLKGVVVKGGHLDEESPTIRDFLVLQDGAIHESKRQRLQNKHLHGTGCTYASALASYLCLGNDAVTSFRLAGEYIEKVIRAGIGQSVVSVQENGPLIHHCFQKKC